eukprot:scaffold234652_cov32-Tisochrysis_lutea.AAC.1
MEMARVEPHFGMWSQRTATPSLAVQELTHSGLKSALHASMASGAIASGPAEPRAVSSRTRGAAPERSGARVVM